MKSITLDKVTNNTSLITLTKFYSGFYHESMLLADHILGKGIFNEMHDLMEDAIFRANCQNSNVEEFTRKIDKSISNKSESELKKAVSSFFIFVLDNIRPSKEKYDNFDKIISCLCRIIDSGTKDFHILYTILYLSALNKKIKLPLEYLVKIRIPKNLTDKAEDLLDYYFLKKSLFTKIDLISQVAAEDEKTIHNLYQSGYINLRKLETGQQMILIDCFYGPDYIKEFGEIAAELCYNNHNYLVIYKLLDFYNKGSYEVIYDTVRDFALNDTFPDIPNDHANESLYMLLYFMNNYLIRIRYNVQDHHKVCIDVFKVFVGIYMYKCLLARLEASILTFLTNYLGRIKEEFDTLEIEQYDNKFNTNYLFYLETIIIMCYLVVPDLEWLDKVNKYIKKYDNKDIPLYVLNKKREKLLKLGKFAEAEPLILNDIASLSADDLKNVIKFRICNVSNDKHILALKEYLKAYLSKANVNDIRINLCEVLVKEKKITYDKIIDILINVVEKCETGEFNILKKVHNLNIMLITYSNETLEIHNKTYDYFLNYCKKVFISNPITIRYFLKSALISKRYQEIIEKADEYELCKNPDRILSIFDYFILAESYNATRQHEKALEIFDKHIMRNIMLLSLPIRINIICRYVCILINNGKFVQAAKILKDDKIIKIYHQNGFVDLAIMFDDNIYVDKQIYLPKFWKLNQDKKKDLLFQAIIKEYNLSLTPHSIEREFSNLRFQNDDSNCVLQSINGLFNLINESVGKKFNFKTVYLANNDMKVEKPEKETDIIEYILNYAKWESDEKVIEEIRRQINGPKFDINGKSPSKVTLLIDFAKCGRYNLAKIMMQQFSELDLVKYRQGIKALKILFNTENYDKTLAEEIAKKIGLDKNILEIYKARKNQSIKIDYIEQAYEKYIKEEEIREKFAEEAKRKIESETRETEEKEKKELRLLKENARKEAEVSKTNKASTGKKKNILPLPKKENTINNIKSKIAANTNHKEPKSELKAKVTVKATNQTQTQMVESHKSKQELLYTHEDILNGNFTVYQKKHNNDGEITVTAKNKKKSESFNYSKLHQICLDTARLNINYLIDLLNNKDIDIKVRNYASGHYILRIAEALYHCANKENSNNVWNMAFVNHLNTHLINVKDVKLLRNMGRRLIAYYDTNGDIANMIAQIIKNSGIAKKFVVTQAGIDIEIGNAVQLDLDITVKIRLNDKEGKNDEYYLAKIEKELNNINRFWGDWINSRVEHNKLNFPELAGGYDSAILMAINNICVCLKETENNEMTRKLVNNRKDNCSFKDFKLLGNKIAHIVTENDILQEVRASEAADIAVSINKYLEIFTETKKVIEKTKLEYIMQKIAREKQKSIMNPNASTFVPRSFNPNVNQVSNWQSQISFRVNQGNEPTNCNDGPDFK